MHIQITKKQKYKFRVTIFYMVIAITPLVVQNKNDTPGEYVRLPLKASYKRERLY